MWQKHLFWGVIVLIVSFLASYVGLTIAGYPETADGVASGGVLLLFFMFVYSRL